MTALSDPNNVKFELADDVTHVADAGYTEFGAYDFLTSIGNEDVLTAAAETHTGAMIALIPSRDDAARVAVDDGEPVDDLHLTLAYLGDAVAFDADARETIIDTVSRYASGPIESEAFAVSTFNPHTDERDTCVVLGIGNTNGQRLTDLRSNVISTLGGMPGLNLPEQHSPWVPHVTLAYSDDPELAVKLRDRAGPITFDRLRFAFGGDIVDVPLNTADDGVSSEEGVPSAVTITTAAGDCPPDQHKMDDGTCMDDNEMTYVDEAWSGTLAFEGVETGDGRLFALGSLDWAPLPEPLMYQPANVGGHNESFIVGEIAQIGRRGNELFGWGTVFGNALAGEHGPGIRNMMKVGGVSVDVDNVKDADVEYVYREVGDGLAGDVSPFGKPEMTIFHRGRIRGATLVAFPAFVGAELSFVGEPSVTTASTLTDDDCGCKGESEGVIVAASHTITIPDLPQASWFSEPTDVSIHGAVTVTDAGRVYGYLAPNGVTHRGKKTRVPMRNVDYSRWMNKETIVEGGGRVVTGVITMNCGHAPTMGYGTLADRIEHYDNSCSIVANVRIGENKNGVWIAGALTYGVTPDQVTRMLGCQLSGDWQPHPDRPGVREFIAALLVPVPGFPMARTMASVTYEDGVVTASVVPMRYVEHEEVVVSNTTDLGVLIASAKDAIAHRIGRDHLSRRLALKQRMGGK